MIAKELDDVTFIDKRRAAGHAAEAQLAFYLRRAFADTPDIHVFNSLRFESQGDAAQIDHLILHPYGLIVVESKSVHARIKINERGEWLQLYKGHYQGMPSAKLQAERQVLFLRRYLEPHSPQLMDAERGERRSLASMPIDLLVAVSDGAVIDRPKGEAHDHLVKAEAVPERLKKLVRSRRPAGGFFGLFKDGFALSSAEMAGLKSFFMSRHRPLEQASPTPAPPSPVTVPTATPAEPVLAPSSHHCKHCGGTRLEVRSGRYGYFFKCLTCEKNTAISKSCGGCGEKERVRKQGRDFYAECVTCGRSESFFVNP